MRIRPSTAILLIMIAIVIRSNPNIIITTIKPVIRILIVIKSKIIKEKKLQEVKPEITPDKLKEKKLQQPKEVKVFPDYVTTKFMVKGGCIANNMWLNNEEILIWADHCQPDNNGVYKTRPYDSPANAISNQLIALPEPALGKAMRSVFRNGEAKEEEVNITKIKNCHALFTIKNGYHQSGDSGGRIWRLVNGQKILIGVHHGGQGKYGTKADGLLTFCKGQPPYNDDDY